MFEMTKLSKYSESYAIYTFKCINCITYDGESFMNINNFKISLSFTYQSLYTSNLMLAIECGMS